MKPGSRIGLSIIGVLALLASAAFVRMTFFAGDDNERINGRTLEIAEAALLSPVEEGLLVAAQAVETPPDEEPSPESLLDIQHPGNSTVAEAAYSKLAVHSSAGGAVKQTLNSPTREGFRLVMGVVERKGDWMRVRLPVRPNGTTGWVKESDVVTRSVPNHIVVEIQKRKLSVFKGSELLWDAPVGVGTAKTPTPPGTYYVDVSAKDPGLGMGAHMLSISGFSNVLTNFGGGIGQLAIHGSSPASVGQFSSNGCLRLTNDTVVRLAKIAPTGTPVIIVP